MTKGASRRRPGLAAAALFAFTCLAAGGAPVAQDFDPDNPYSVVNGKVDRGTYNGFRRYHASCHTCHGPDGLGSSYGPALTDSLKTMGYDEFLEVVAVGREVEKAGTPSVMPSFGMTEDVMLYIDDIYAYLKARSDGALGRGRPQRQ